MNFFDTAQNGYSVFNAAVSFFTGTANKALTPHRTDDFWADIGYSTNLEAHPELIPFKAIRQRCQSRMLTGQILVQSLKKQCMLWTSTIAETSMICEIIGIKADFERCCPAYTILVDKGEYIRAEALLDMAYNMGVGIAPHGGKKGSGLLGFYTFLPYMERGVYIKAAEGLKCSRWYQQVGT